MSASVLPLMMPTSGLWSTTSSNLAPLKKSLHFFTAHVTASNSTSVAEYLDSAGVTHLLPHCSSFHLPLSSSCQSAYPSPLD